MMNTRPGRLRVLLPALCAATLLAGAAACSGGPDGPTVAQGTGTPSAAAHTGGDPFQRGLEYAKCMRQHGVPNFPDPERGPGGTGVAIKLDKNTASSPKFASAQRACRSLQPGGGPKSGGGKVDATKIGPWADCMRSHGVPDLPDPKNKGNALELDLTGTGVNPRSAAFENAVQACKSTSPGGGMMVKSSKS